MSTLLRSIEFLCLSLWLGSDVFLSFVVAPGAFSVLSARDQAGAFVGFALGRLHFFGVLCGIVFLVARLIRLRMFTRPDQIGASLVTPAALAVVLMIALTVASQHGVTSRLARLRSEMGSIEKTPAESPLRIEFDKLHRLSVRLEGGVLLAGLAALILLVRENAR